MQFLPKWSQNVSKFILFHKWTAIFKFNINFKFEQPFSNSISILNFLPIFIFLKCFCRYLKMWKIANLGYGNGRNSKTIYPIYMIFGRHMQKTNIYKTMKSFFFIFCSNFKLRHKIPWLAASWLPWQPHQKSSFMVLCKLFLCTTLPSLKVLRKLVFELCLLPCLTNQRPSLVTMATRLKRQPFSKSTGHGLRGGISSMWAGI